VKLNIAGYMLLRNDFIYVTFYICNFNFYRVSCTITGNIILRVLESSASKSAVETGVQNDT